MRGWAKSSSVVFLRVRPCLCIGPALDFVSITTTVTTLKNIALVQLQDQLISYKDQQITSTPLSRLTASPSSTGRRSNYNNPLMLT